MGQTVAASFQTPTLFLIATDLSKMEVDTNVSESDVGDVQAGDRATFTVEAFPRQTFEGVVSQVRQAPQTVQNVVTYDIVILVANPKLFLKPGMTATVRIITAERDHVLRVPVQALRYMPGGISTEAGQGEPPPPRLSVLRNGRPIRIPVVTGLDDDNFVEILKGDVHEGDRVIMSEQSSSAGGSAVSRPAMRFP